MKITRLDLDGFGVWNQLRLEEVSTGLTVIYGPNEAGKTTLLQFVRSVLYGYSSERRQRYLPPLKGGRGGGSMHLATAGGTIVVHRHDDAVHPTIEGQLRLTGLDGKPSRDVSLRSLIFAEIVKSSKSLVELPVKPSGTAEGPRELIDT